MPRDQGDASETLREALHSSRWAATVRGAGWDVADVLAVLREHPDARTVRALDELGTAVLHLQAGPSWLACRDQVLTLIAARRNAPRSRP